MAPPHAEDDEGALIDGLRRNDRKAAARFVAAHVDAVYGYARHRLGGRADLVDDIVQDVFLAALAGIAGFRCASSLRTWLIGIARHKIDDVYRQHFRAPSDDGEPPHDELAATAAPFEDDIDARRSREKTHKILAQLPSHYSLVLVWRYWEQRSTRDMAAAIHTTEKSVERMLARARAQFRQLWQKE